MHVGSSLGAMAVGLFLSLAARARSEQPLQAAIALLVRPKLERGEAVGMVVGVVRDRRSEVFGFGKVSEQSPDAPDGGTIFEIGSMTKLFTSLALADMAREGLVRLDDPIAPLLPEGVRVPERDGRAITLRTLANHTSGLPRLLPVPFAELTADGGPYAKVKADDLYAFLKRASLSSTPGEKFLYSNIGPGLLGTALARRAGISYEELIVSRICRPLQLSDTRATLDEARSGRQAKPYLRAGKPSVYWYFDALAGAGALRSTADDMLAFARANLGLAEAPERLREAMRDMRTPTADMGRGGRKVGLAWLIVPARKGRDRPEAFVHNGGTGGFRSYLAIAPSTSAAVVVLSNSAGEVDTIGDAALGLVTRSGGARSAPE